MAKPIECKIFLYVFSVSKALSLESVYGHISARSDYLSCFINQELQL